MTADFQRGRFANPPNKDCAVSCEKKGLMPLTCHASGGATGVRPRRRVVDHWCTGFIASNACPWAGPPTIASGLPTIRPESPRPLRTMYGKILVVACPGYPLYVQREKRM